MSADELGALETLTDAQRWLWVIGSAVVEGRLDKGDAQAGVRAIETWTRAADSLTEGEMERLAEKLDALKGQGRPGLRRMK